jgi:hypothetical protein
MEIEPESKKTEIPPKHRLGNTICINCYTSLDETNHHTIGSVNYCLECAAEEFLKLPSR